MKLASYYWIPCSITNRKRRKLVRTQRNVCRLYINKKHIKLARRRWILCSNPRRNKEKECTQTTIYKCFKKSKQIKLAGYHWESCNNLKRKNEYVDTQANRCKHYTSKEEREQNKRTQKRYDGSKLQQPYVRTQLALATMKESQNKLICGSDKKANTQLAIATACTEQPYVRTQQERICLLYTSPSPRD